MTHEIIRRDTGEIVPYDGGFRILDTYADEPSIIAPSRPDWLATISAGRKVEKNGQKIPEVSRDGTIYVSGDTERSAGLREVLAANGGKHLTITFPYDDLDGFIIQRFTRRSATALEVYGDASSLTEIKNGVHSTFYPGDPQYKALKATCKVETSVLFGLCRWVGMQSRPYFPDGFGWYRFRFTSRNSLRSIVGKLQEVTERITRGHIAGLPWELSITYRDVAGPDGRNRNIPIWSIDFKPPQTIELSSGNLSGLLRSSLAEGQKLKLLDAPDYTLTDAASEDEDFDLDVPAEAAVETLTSSDPPCDPRYWENIWFSTVRDTRFQSDEARADFLRAYTRGAHTSLSEFLAEATEAEASGLVADVVRVIEADRLEKQRNRDAYVERVSAEHDELVREMADTSDGEPLVIEHEPEPVDDGPALITEDDDLKWQGWLSLVTIAQREGVGVAPIKLPIAEDDLDLVFHDLKEAIKNKRAADKELART